MCEKRRTEKQKRKTQNIGIKGLFFWTFVDFLKIISWRNASVARGGTVKRCHIFYFLSA